MVSLLFSALTFSINHTGHTNSYEINSESELALKYNDRSVIQQHAASIAFQLLRNNRLNFF